MLDADVSYWAVLVAAISSMVIGFLWYGPLFGKQWMKLMGFAKESTEKMKGKASQSYFLMFLAALVGAYVLGRFLGTVGVADAADGASVAFWAWLGFVMPVQLGVVLWENKPSSLFLLNTAYSLVSLLVAGAILAAWA